jgi:hypothetical protein
VRRFTPLAVVSLAIFLSALVTCAIVSSESDYRWRPLWLVGVFMTVGLPIALLTPRDSV